MGEILHSVCFMLVVCRVILQPIHGHTESFKGGHCLSSPDDTRIFGIVYLGCLDECRARQSCIGVSYRAVAKECRLYSNRDGGPPSICPGYVFSKKEHWKRVTLPGCPMCGDGKACIMDKLGTPICVHKDCRGLPNIENGKIFGNRMSVGSKLTFACDLESKVMDGFTTCEANGMWTDIDLACGTHRRYRFPTGDSMAGLKFDLYDDQISLDGRTSFSFRLKASAAFVLYLKPDKEDPYTLFGLTQAVQLLLGDFNNTLCALLRPRDTGSEKIYYEDEVLSDKHFRAFWVITGDCVQVGKGPTVGQNEILELCGLGDLSQDYVFFGIKNTYSATIIFD